MPPCWCYNIVTIDHETALISFNLSLFTVISLIEQVLMIADGLQKATNVDECIFAIVPELGRKRTELRRDQATAANRPPAKPPTTQPILTRRLLLVGSPHNIIIK